MKGLQSPIFKTKIDGLNQKFSLPTDRKAYFQAKAGQEIEKIREYLKDNTFMAFLLGPKNSGKGTYTKLFMEMVGPENVAHISVGDIVRNVHYNDLVDEGKKKDLITFLERRYRGYMPLEDIIATIEGRNQTSLLPTEVILALVEREIDKLGRKAVFIDGFPRNVDQLAYALYFRALMGYRDDPDFFVFIDVPISVINERIKNRVICPKCQTPRSLRLLRTKEVGYDERTKEFYLICDNSSCEPTRMVAKEGDAAGIAPIKDRIELDIKIMQQLLQIQGVPKIQLRNSIPTQVAHEYIDEYEATPSYRYMWNQETKSVEVTEEPWKVKDDDGIDSYSLLPEAVALGLIKKIASTLGL